MPHEIETKRLYIRKNTENDYQYYKMLYAGENNPINKFYKNDPELLEKSCYNTFVKCKDEVFLVFQKDTDDFCGRLELRDLDDDKELGVDFLEEHQNKGFGTESIIAFCNWLHKNRNYSELIIRIDPANERSQHVFKKLGVILLGQKSAFPTELAEQMRKFDPDWDSYAPYYYKLPLPIKSV